MLDNVVAGEIFSSGYCNARCKYCYIPKVPEMLQIHKEIQEKLSSGKYISNLRGRYGDKLESLGFWGTEPTLTLDLIKDSIEYYLIAFPNLKVFDFSTNMLENTESIHRFIKRLDDICKLTNRSIRCKVQISLDGPDFITDKNRREGATKRIIENYKKLVNFIKNNTNKVFIEMSFKPTLSKEDMCIYNNNTELFKDYFDLFDEIQEDAIDIKNLRLVPTISGTLVVPGNYSSEDGRIFAKYIDNLHKFNIWVRETNPYKNVRGDLFSYNYRFDTLMSFKDELYSKHSMFTCSAGDSCRALDETGAMHICHRTYFLNNKKYEEAVLEGSTVDNWDVSVFETNKNEIVKKNYIVDAGESDLKFDYITRAFHDFYNHKIGFTKAIVTELALVNQASKIYHKNEELLNLFALFINTVFACPAENILNTGVIHMVPLSTIRVWANGAFENLIDYYTDFRI